MDDKKLFGKDLKIVDRYPGQDLIAGITASGKRDFRLAEGRENLSQALTLRLITPQGMLSKVGHSSYGSRLYELIGELNNPTNRKLVELYTRETLVQDLRVKEIKEIKVTTSESARNRVDIHISLIPVETEIPLNIMMPFYF